MSGYDLQPIGGVEFNFKRIRFELRSYESDSLNLKFDMKQGLYLNASQSIGTFEELV
jgi:hypothetical protein